MRAPPQQPGWRLGLVVTLIGAAMAVIGWKVLDLQIIDNNVLQREGDARTVRNDVIVATRGNIVDRNGEPLAISTPVLSLWLNPKEILSNPQQGQQLAEAMQSIGVDPQSLNRRIVDNANREFAYIKRAMPPAQAQAVLDLKLKGVYAQEEYKRYYPMGEAAVHVVGLANNDEVGQEGLELAYEDTLKGTPGSRQVLKDRLGRIVREVKINANPQPGKELVLAMDSRLQYIAYKALKEAVTMRNASAGTATVLDARTGEVLAMVSQPSYNPNNRNTMTDAGRKNRAMVDLMEPGSTAKTFAVTAALETGLFTTSSIIDTSPGYVMIDRKPIKDPVNYGPSTLARIIAKSSQVGASKVALTIGPEPMLSVLARVGFGTNLGTGFPGETSGVLPNHSRWSKSEIATMAYGYGFQVTPLQLAQAYLVYANDGVRKPVSFLKVNGPVQGERVIEKQLAHTVAEMLQGVVSKEMGGTGVRANIPSYQVAGKSGTTWYYDVGRGGYDDSNYISHFAGFVPASNPRVVIVVSVQRPQGSEYGGGAVAAPVFSQIAAGAMRVLNVPPDQPENDGMVVSQLSGGTDARP
ncbi:MAG TPA: penicillin-binding protein 2 [Hyphomicrobiales bacterium]|nr:penicillin-binding protein 2 [Hyphomicrobiales bacterium]